MKTEDTDIQRVWLCDACGEMCTSDMCMKCGRERSPSAPYAPEPSSYLGIIGAPRSMLAGKYLLAILVVIYLVQLIISQTVSRANGPVFTAPERPVPSGFPR